MKYFKKFKCAMLVFPILSLLGLSACQGQQPETSVETTDSQPVISENVKEDTKVAELLSSLQMHHFKEKIKAPEFDLPSIDGGTVSLSQYKGEVVLLSFWATW